MQLKMFQKRGVWWVDARSMGAGRLSTGTADRAEAERIAKAKIAAALAAPKRPTSAPLTDGPTIAEAYRLALRSRPTWRSAKAQHSLDDNYAALAGYFGPDKPLAAITREDVLGWVKHMETVEPGKRLVAGEGREVGLKPSTVNHRLSMLSVLLRESDLPALRMPRLRVGQGRIRTFTPEELERIEGWFRASSLKGAGDMADLVVVLSGTAMRLSEALKLTAAEVDGGAAKLWDTKSGKPRTLPLSGRAGQVVTHRADLYPRGPIFPLSPYRANDLWATMRSALGYAHDREFVIHALRHTALTRLAGAGFNALQIQAFAGHSQIETTQKYVHLAGADLKALSASLAGGSH
jgi:integrase